MARWCQLRDVSLLRERTLTELKSCCVAQAMLPFLFIVAVTLGLQGNAAEDGASVLALLYCM